MAQSGRLIPLLCRIRSALLVIGLVCALPWLAEAQEDLSRDAAREKLNKTEQQLQSNRAKEQGLTQDLASLAAERAKPSLPKDVGGVWERALIRGICFAASSA